MTTTTATSNASLTSIGIAGWMDKNTTGSNADNYTVNE
jgi:hypothetical protein